MKNALLFTFVSSLAACAFVQLAPPVLRTAGVPPAVSLGPELLVLADHGQTHVAAAASGGELHVIITSDTTLHVIRPRRARARHLSVRELMVDDCGEIPGLRFDGASGEPSLASDGHGTLHLAVASEYRVLEDGLWREVEAFSIDHVHRLWEEGAHFATQDVALGFGGGNFLGAYRVAGSQVGAPVRFELVGGAAYGGVAIVPWVNLPEKAVVFRQRDAHVATWIVEPETRSHVLEWDLAGDDRGGLHLLYRTDAEGSVSYAHVEPGRMEDQLAPLVGMPIGEHPKEPSRTSGKIQLAVDPATGTALAGVIREERIWHVFGPAITRLIEAGEVGEPVLLADEVSDLRIAAAGDDTFHAVARLVGSGGYRIAPIVYFQWRQGSWSQPVELGKGTKLVELVADGEGGAWALWWHKSDLFGRRIERPTVR